MPMKRIRFTETVTYEAEVFVSDVVLQDMAINRENYSVRDAQLRFKQISGVVRNVQSSEDMLMSFDDWQRSKWR